MQETKRYTSGLDKNGTSKIIQQDIVKTEVPYPNYPSFSLNNLFYTEESPQSPATRHNNSVYDIKIPANALRIKKIRMPTQREIINDLTANGETIPEDWTQYNLHRTDTVDYIYILSGNISYITDNERTELHEGDFLAQIAPVHTWINENDEPCILLCIMCGIAPTGQTVGVDAD